MIFISTQCFPPEQGGIQSLVYSLCAALSASGENVRVFADARSASDSVFDHQQTFPALRYSGLKPLRRRKKAREIVRLSAEQGSTAVRLITDSWKSLEHMDTKNFSTVLCLAHGTEIPAQSSLLKSRRIRKALSKATYVVANSAYTANRITPYVKDSGKIRVILPGVSAPANDETADLSVRQTLSGHDPVLITMARLEQRKGQLSVIRLLPRLVERFPKLKYVIAGEGSFRNVLEQAVQNLHMQDHVLFTGNLKEPYKTAWLKNSSLFVMPGSMVGQDVEGFGLAYIDAALLGVPSIACNVGGAPEAVLHNQTGLVCESENPETLAQCILELTNNQSFCKQLGINARLRAHSFLWQTKSTEYLALLRS